MKKVINLFIALFITSFAFAQNNYVVSSDMNPNVDFEDYKTFGWTSQIEDETFASYSLNDLLLKNSIKETIRQEMKGLGYEKSQNPDLLLSFMVFDKETEFTGYGPLKTDDFYYDYWFGFGEKQYLGKPTQYNFKEGTILIHILDKEKGEIIWQGYASGVMDNDVFDRNPDNIAEAVELVFEGFAERADDYRETGR